MDQYTYVKPYWDSGKWHFIATGEYYGPYDTEANAKAAYKATLETNRELMRKKDRLLRQLEIR